MKGPTPRSRFRPRSKYGAVPKVVDNIRFHSTREAGRYGELMLLGKAGAIRNLEYQPRFPLSVNGVLIGTYIADFRYQERDAFGDRDIIEEVKGWDVPLGKWKRKHCEAQYGVTVTVVK